MPLHLSYMNKEDWKLYGWIILVLSLVKLTIQCIGNRNYGFHRDELLHLSAGKHLDWGYMEFPPFIGWLGRLSEIFFNNSLTGTRLFSTLAGVGIIVITCMMVKEMKGRRAGVFLAGMCILGFASFYRNHTLFQPVAFDQLFWTLGFYFFIRYINRENKNDLIWMGVILGCGLMNKYTMLVWGFGAFIGILSYRRAALFKNKWLYISGLIALVVFLPNILWQANHNFPLFSHLSRLRETQLEEIGAFQFLIDQIESPFTFIVIVLGIIGTFALSNQKKYIPISVAAIIMFSTMWILKSKTYYIYALYPVLFALGARMIEILSKNRSWLPYVVGAIMVIPVIPYIPHMTPVFSIDQYLDYAEIEEEDGRYIMTGDYADMHGWEEQAAIIDSVYKALSEEDRAACVLWAENYGEAGAMMVLGDKYNLPDPICRHGSFWTWGHGNASADVWLSLGNEEGAIDYAFHEKELVKIIKHPYAIGEEHNIPVYLCRRPKVDISDWWASYEPYIFQ